MSRIHSGRMFYAGLLEALTQVMGSAKGYLVEHGPRVALVASQVGDRMGLSKRQVSELLFASILSDMGMVGLAEDAWENPVPELPPDVRARVRQHPLRSEERVGLIPHLGALAPLVRHHHEWWDGSGYPDGLSGSDIPLGAQILRLADTVVALGQHRPHRLPLSEGAILEAVERGAGTEFGPEVARVYTGLHRSGDIPEYDGAAFRHAVSRASEHLLPDEVSPLSSDQLLSILANLIDAKDPYTAGHSRRVATLGVAVAGELGLQRHMRTTLWAGGYLHDLGKLKVPLRILAKTSRLTEREFAQVRAHPGDGATILEGIPSLRHLTTGARYHHERWDGGGYPEGLRGDHIPLIGQILAVCDSYDAMTSKRAYRDSRTHLDAVEEVARCAGVHFSPRVAAAFLDLPAQTFESVKEDVPSPQGPFRVDGPQLRSPGARAAAAATRAV
jgi:HD-GYP domain-containing protein (c-di-GMP phosphodiesterase class II)